MNFLCVFPEVVYVENHYGAHGYDGEPGHNLLKVDDWTVLPDGTRQPLNLYKAIAGILKNNQDNLALFTINKMFKKKYNGKVGKTVLMKSNIAHCTTELEMEEKQMLEVVLHFSGIPEDGMIKI